MSSEMYIVFLIGLLLGITLGSITVYYVAVVELARAGFPKAQQDRFVRFFRLANDKS